MTRKPIFLFSHGRRWTLAGLVIAACLPLVGRAQQPSPSVKPQPPSGPLLKPAPAFAKWLMNYSYPADRPENKQSARPSSFDPAAPRKVLVTKTQDIIHEETWYVSDKKLDKWQQGERFYFKAPGLSFWAAYDQASQKNNLTLDPKLLPFPKTGFRGLDWIGTQTYAGTMKSDKGNLLLVFVPQNADKLDVNDAKALERQSLIAYIDVETRLPSIVRERNVVCTYAFYPPPGTIQALPPDLAAEIKAGDEKRAKLNSAPVKEY